MKWKPISLNYALNLVKQEFKGFIPLSTIQSKKQIKLTQIKDKKK